jgi:cytochrome c-type protein NapC
MLGKFWRVFREQYPSRGKAAAVIAASVLVFVLVSAVLVIGGAAGLAWTNTEKFCTGCHEMRDNVYAEYTGTIHDTNRTGVRAICSDCHVPREPVALIKAKINAMHDLYSKAMGTIDTKEKFEAHRSEMAQRVWRRMKASDSAPCRNCHNAAKMDEDKQSDRAKARHAKGKAEGKTCIDCHFAIAHKEPSGPGPADIQVSSQ